MIMDNIKFYVTLLLLTTLITSCEKEEEDNTANKEKVYEHINQKDVRADAEGNLYIGDQLVCPFVEVKSGTFYMGAQGRDASKPNYRESAQGNEGPVHEVKITKDYLIGQFEVTQALWRAVMGETDPVVAKWAKYEDLNKDGIMNRHCIDSRYNNPADTSEGDGLGDEMPAYWIDYADIVEFLSELNKMTGAEYRLPTEAEWEYAANGGHKATIITNQLGGTRYHYWAGSDDAEEVCVFGNPNFEFGKPHLEKGGTKAPNELGIYDMSGNVWEWTADYFSTSFYKEEKSDINSVDPICTTPSLFRAIKGGGWESLSDYCFSNYRGIDCRAYGSNIRCYGFRLAITK